MSSGLHGPFTATTLVTFVEAGVRTWLTAEA
jgi:hypothetical protein